jgi:L-ascorbate metabolism protein UlaG (beta-lactamase superfamily)
VLITHQHADHVDTDRLPALLERNPEAVLHADAGTAAQLAAHGLPVTAVDDGDVLDLGARVRVVGREHALIHPDIPRVPNTGYLVEERFFHPGDALTVPDADLEVLAVPAVAPWSKVAETIDYLRAVAPRVAVPVHDAILAVTTIHYTLLRNLGPEGTEFRPVEDGTAIAF